jgi:hypothetical protein
VKLPPCCLALCLTVSAAAAAATFAAPRPAVVELFTSEGCSSCPPAEALIGELAQRPQVLALAFHVDYWDSLGWRDRFALPDAVRRQQQYARSLAHLSVYTPELVLDGRTDYVGSDRHGIEAAVAGARTGLAVDFSAVNGNLTVSLGGGQCLGPSEVLLISYLRKAVSAIGRGENAGRTLQEFNIVRSILTLGHWDGTAQHFEVPLATLPADATDVALIVQSPASGQIIGAGSRPIR